VPTTADQAIASWRTARAERERVIAAGAGGVTPKWFWDPDPPQGMCAARGDVPRYTQLPPRSGPNTSSCYSGCGPRAWAMIAGGASQQAAHGGADGAFAGLYRNGNDALGAIAVAPNTMNAQAGELSWTLREQIGTFCAGDQGATTMWDMED